MADEVVPQGEAAAPEAPEREPRNVREAIEMRRAGGDPGFVEVSEEEAHAPYSDATIDDDGDTILDEEEQEAPAAAAPAPEAGADRFSDFGGEQRVRDAVVIADALQTEQGVRAVVAQGLQALGYNVEHIRNVLNGQQVEDATPAAGAPAPAPADPFADLGDDDVVTGAELKQMLGGLVQRIEQSVATAQQTATQPLQEQIQEQRATAARTAVDNTLVEVLKIDQAAGVTELQKEQIGDVQQFAAKYLDPGDWNPENIRAALIRGHADMVARDERRFKAYRDSKRVQREAQPANIGGASPAGGEEVKEPRNMKEAIAMRKAQNVF